MNKPLPDFGDRVVIEMHRYGVDNEFFTHKVINHFRSNTWREVPLKSGELPVTHPSGIEDVLTVVQEGIDETQGFIVRASDTRLLS